MNPDTSPTFWARRAVQQEAARWWWVPLVGAAVWFVVAWLVIRANYTSLATVGVLVGIVFLIAAVNEAGLASVMRGGWVVWHAALSVLLVLGAIWAFVRPVNTFFALASMLGLLLLLQGVFVLVRGIAMRDVTPYWWLDLVGGGLLTVLGLWVSTSDRVWNLASRAAFILLWVGFMAIFRAISDIGMAFSLRRLAHEDIGRREWPQTRVDTAPPVGQHRTVPSPEATAAGSGAPNP